MHSRKADINETDGKFSKIHKSAVASASLVETLNVDLEKAGAFESCLDARRMVPSARSISSSASASSLCAGIKSDENDGRECTDSIQTEITGTGTGSCIGGVEGVTNSMVEIANVSKSNSTETRRGIDAREGVKLSSCFVTVIPTPPPPPIVGPITLYIPPSPPPCPSVNSRLVAPAPTLSIGSTSVQILPINSKEHPTSVQIPSPPPPPPPPPVPPKSAPSKPVQKSQAFGDLLEAQVPKASPSPPVKCKSIVETPPLTDHSVASLPPHTSCQPSAPLPPPPPSVHPCTTPAASGPPQPPKRTSSIRDNKPTEQ